MKSRMKSQGILLLSDRESRAAERMRTAIIFGMGFVVGYLAGVFVCDHIDWFARVIG